ncbi:unnamed protein product [Peniophora sp. CBMAI 1063]|nr:unnamed protein product [Peniophora sp. CBMAI 1063]
MDPRKKAPKVALSALHSVFRKRMNKPPVPPQTFSRAAELAARVQARDLARIVPDIEPDDTFTREVDAREVALLKADVKKQGLDGAPGFDGVLKSSIMNMDNDDLARLFNECIRQQDAPSVWLKTVVIGIMKKGLPEGDANSYRTIGLECVILPASQNGFRHGFRTNNNVFVLRTILEKYRDEQPVYIAFIDISNAFPSTNRDILFVKLQRMGCVGPVIDWLRRLYSEMRYVVELEGAYSEEFRSDIGVLIGDPSSPTLWNLFLADFRPPDHEDDPIIAGQRMPIMLHADDMLGARLGHQGMQALLSYVGRYAARAQLNANAIKSMMMLAGKIPNKPPVFHLQGVRVPYVARAKYVGLPMCATEYNPFEPLYPEAAAKAHRAAIAITGARSVVGRLKPVDAKTLYDARVECYLILGADAVPDIGSHIQALEDVQHAFCRRVLGLRTRSLLIPLFTELGIVPIRFRRIKLALRFLRYVADQPEGRYVRLAMEEAFAMYEAGIPGWLGDLAYAMRRLPHKVEIPRRTASLWNPDTADDLMRLVDASMRAEIQDAILASSRLYLLRDRTEPQRRGAPTKPVIQMRHYLTSVVDDDDRIALTKLLASDHPFALEQLRWSSTRNGIKRSKVPRDDRLCRLCGLDVESPEHALLVCKGVPELLRVRDDFAGQVREHCPDLPLRLTSNDALTVLVTLISTPELARYLAAFTRKVFSIFDSYALQWPVAYIERVEEDEDDDDD